MHDDSIIPPSVPRLKTFVDSGRNGNQWQDQLLPVDTVLGEEDVTVLRHLTEQLVGYEAHQAQLEKDLETAQRDSHREAEKLKEFQSICQDLRSQLRRQQARICEYKTVLKNNSNTFVPDAKVASRQMVSFGYAAVAVEDPASASPVSPWSATDPVSFSNAFASCCRKLAALDLESASDVQHDSPQTLPTPQSSIQAKQPPTLDVELASHQSSPQPELPKFVR